MPKPYRENVAFILRRSTGEVLLCERSDFQDSWQFPQGGVDNGETIEQAIEREVFEEIGLSPAQYRIVERRGPYKYKFTNNAKRKHYAGQIQTYFLADALGEVEIDFGTADPEFRNYQWILPADIDVSSVPPIKQAVYRALLRDFFGVLPEGTSQK